MPVEISYRPRPSSFSAPRICVSFVTRSTLADLIDLPENLDSAFEREQVEQLSAAFMRRGGDSDERNIGGAGAAGVIDGVADVEHFLRRPHRGDFEQAVRRRFFVLDVVR